MSQSKLDPEYLRDIASVMTENGLSEVEWSDGEQRLKLARQITVVAAAPAGPVPAPVAPGSAAAEPAQPSLFESPPAVPPGSVVSPMVGTAYLSPEPGAAPFVRLGDRVEEGDTLLIIEAMKVMNPIRAAHAGTISRILVQDAQPVEYGEILMGIE